MELILSFLLPLFTGGLVFFSYRQGLKDGGRLKDGKTLNPVLSRPATVTTAASPEDNILDFVEKYEG